MNLMIEPGMFVCSSFLISVCMFIVSKALLISSATVIVCAGGGAIWLKPIPYLSFCLSWRYHTSISALSNFNPVSVILIIILYYY